jgi:hypothetical protein
MLNNNNNNNMVGSFRRLQQRQVQVQQQTPVAAAIASESAGGNDDPPAESQQQQTIRTKNRFKLFSRRHNHHNQQQQHQPLATPVTTPSQAAVMRDTTSDDTSDEPVRRDSGSSLRRLLSNQRISFSFYQQRQVDEQKSVKAVRNLMIGQASAKKAAAAAVAAAFQEDETSASTLVEEEDARNDINITEHKQSMQQSNDVGCEEHILRRRADEGDEKLARFLKQQSQASTQQQSTRQQYIRQQSTRLQQRRDEKLAGFLKQQSQASTQQASTQQQSTQQQSTQQQSTQQQSTQQQSTQQQPHDDGCESHILRHRADDSDEKMARFLMRQSQAFEEILNEEEAPPRRTQNSNSNSNSNSSKSLHRQSTAKTSSSSSMGSFRTSNSRQFYNSSHSHLGSTRHDTSLRYDNDSDNDNSQTESRMTRQPFKPPRVVCQCCFEDIAQPAERSFTCSAVMAATATAVAKSGSTTDGQGNSNDKSQSHSFCNDCVKRYVESWVFGGAYYTLRERDKRERDTRTHGSAHAAVAVGALPCLSGTCTTGWFTDNTVSRVVSAKVREQYQEKMVASSKTNTKPLPSPSDDSKVKVNSNVHSNVKLDKKALLEQGYRQAEEALTYAKMRQCTYCNVSFLKEADSCNKMTCPSCICRHAMCYICRKPVETNGYEHFCQHSYDNCSEKCGKCPLWTLQDDVRDGERLRQVAEEHANRVWGESLLRDDGQDEIRLDVDKLLLAVYGTEIASSSTTL